jgi:hypothetical protein
MPRAVFSQAVEPLILTAHLPAADLLPLIPHDATLAPGSKVDPTQRGKVPGTHKGGDEWAGMVGTWASAGLTEDQQARTKNAPTENVGLRAERFPALDIDVSDEGLAEEIATLADLTLGTGAIRTRAGSPRLLLMYRLGQGRNQDVEPVRKHRIAFHYRGQEHAVEFLGLGQHYVVAGIHPSGQRYGWREGYDLLGCTAEGLPVVTAARVATFMQDVARVIEQAGGTIKVRQATEGGSGEAGHAVSELEAVMTPELALSALFAIPNDPENVPTREGLVSILSGFKAALGKRAEDYRSEAGEWATRHGWADWDYFEKVWESLTHVRASHQALIKEAKKKGWRGDVMADFDGLPVEDADKMIAEAQAVAADEADVIAGVASHVVYWDAKEKWIEIGGGTVYSHSGLDYSALGIRIAPAGKTGMNSAHAKLRNSGMVRDVRGLTYWPGQPRTFTGAVGGDFGLWFNNYRAPAPVEPANAADVRPWLDHLEWLFPDEGERKSVLQWMAHVIQRPGVKLRWALVIIGGQGVGKDTVIKPLVKYLGEGNAGEVKTHNIEERFNGWLERQLIVVQELRRSDKLDIYQKLKDWVSGTGADTVMIDRKSVPEYYIRNLAAWIFLTNHADAFRIEPDERRLHVVQCAPASARDQDYYDTLHEWLNRKGSLEKVAGYLSRVDLSDFSADRAPQWTEAKRAMAEMSLTNAGQWLLEQFTTPGGIYEGRSVVLGDEITALRRDPSVPVDVRQHLGALTVSQVFGTMGWIKRNRQVRLADGRQPRVWCRTAEIANSSNEVVKSRVEKELREAVSAAARDFK